MQPVINGDKVVSSDVILVRRWSGSKFDGRKHLERNSDREICSLHGRADDKETGRGTAGLEKSG